MAADDLLARVRCPASKQPLAWASDDLIEGLNARIEAGGVTDVGGEPVDQPLDRGAVRQDGRLVYPERDGVLRLVPERAVSLDGEREASPQG